MFNRDDLDKYYNHISQNLFEYDNLDFVKFFRENYHTGTNKFYQKNISETKKFDDNWIKVLESHLPSIDKIIKNPRSFIKYDEDVVAIDKAKNPGQRSFQVILNTYVMLKKKMLFQVRFLLKHLNKILMFMKIDLFIL